MRAGLGMSDEKVTGRERHGRAIVSPKEKMTEAFKMTGAFGTSPK